jgi:hypothetical protein
MEAPQNTRFYFGSIEFLPFGPPKKGDNICQRDKSQVLLVPLWGTCEELGNAKWKVHSPHQTKLETPTPPNQKNILISRVGTWKLKVNFLGLYLNLSEWPMFHASSNRKNQSMGEGDNM